MTNETEIWIPIEYSTEPQPTKISKEIVRIRRNITSETRIDETGAEYIVWKAEEMQIDKTEYENSEWVSKTEVKEAISLAQATATTDAYEAVCEELYGGET